MPSPRPGSDRPSTPPPDPGRSLLRARAALALALGAVVATAAPAAVAQAAPDLVIDSLQADPTSGRNGTVVDLDIRVRNQGRDAAPASKTRVRINTDAGGVLSTDPAICNLDTPALAPGASAAIGCSPTLGSRPPGANWIWAIADANKDAGQDNTDNDRASVAFTINDDAPDLVVQQVTVGPPSVPNGEPVSVSVTVRNQGKAPALASTTRVRINVDPDNVASTDTILCNMSTPTIAVGASVSVGCNPTIGGRPPGTNWVWAIADVNKTAGQLVVDNDRGKAVLDVSALASDLVVDSVTASPTSGRNGTQVTVTATIRNQGTATAPASIARFRVNQSGDNVGSGDPVLCRSVETPSLEVGKTAVVKCKATLEDRPSGENFLWVIADAANSAGQADLTNDRAAAPFLVDPPAVPDLVVRSVALNPTTAALGQAVTVTMRVANEGEVAAPATKTRVLFNTDAGGVGEDDAVLCDAVSTLALSPGASVNVSCKPVLTGLPVGAGFVWAVADALAESGETVVDNNATSAALTVQAAPAPDLVVEGVTATPPSAGLGAAVAVVARIRNNGNAAAAASTTRVRLLPVAPTIGSNAVLCEAVPTAALAVGAALDVPCNWIVGAQAPGSWSLEVLADAGGTAGQANRTNDTRTAPFTVLSPVAPDLVVKRVTLDPTSLRNGDTLLVKARITNVGTAPAPASVAAFRINGSTTNVGSGDEALCAARATKALAPGETARIRCSATVMDRPEGAQSVWVVADATQTAGQANTANDKRRAALTVLPSDCADPAVTPTLAWPVEEPRVLQDWASFGSVPQAGRSAYHSGLDVASHLAIAPEALPVYAAADGEVIAANSSCPSPADTAVDGPSGRCGGGWGNYVVVRHGGGLHTVYAQLGEVFVTEGCVEQGQRIALAGSSGLAGLPVHVHFGVVAAMPEPFARKLLGGAYYRKTHPTEGVWPESDTGVLVEHRDPRGFAARTVVRVAQATTASRGSVTGGPAAWLAKGQEYVSYGELVPGYHCIDLPWPDAPEDGPPWGDDVRYGWVPAAALSVLGEASDAVVARVDGFAVFQQEGVGPNDVELRSQASQAASVLTKAWAGQAFAPVGAPVLEASSGRTWRAVHVPGTAASGAGRPREAWLPVDTLHQP